MANKYIPQLSGITHPSLTGYTIYDDTVTTYKMTLNTLKDAILSGSLDYNTAFTASFALTGSNHFNGNQYVTGSVFANNAYFSGSVTGAYFVGDGSHLTNLPIQTTNVSMFLSSSIFNTVSSSFNQRIALATNEQDLSYFATTGSNHFKGDQFVSGSVLIGTGSFNQSAKEMLHVENSGSFNIAHFEGNVSNYAQIEVQNHSNHRLASSDIVVTADNGDEDIFYVDLGINSSTYNAGYVGYANDGYLINVGNDMYVGSVGGGAYPANTFLFAENMWQNPQIAISGSAQIGFNTSSVETGFLYEFSGSVKLDHDLKVIGTESINNIQNIDTDLNIITHNFNNIGLFAEGGTINVTGSLLVSGSQVIQSVNPNANYVSKFAGYVGGAKMAIGVSSDPNFGVTNDILNGDENGYSPYTITAESITINAPSTFNANIDTNGNSIRTNGGDIRGNNFRVDNILNLGSTSERFIITDGGSMANTQAPNFDYNYCAIAYVSNYINAIDINLINVPEESNKALGFTVILDETTNKEINSFVINNEVQSILWFGGSQPDTMPNVFNIFSFSMLRISGTWKVFGQLTTF